MYVFCLSCLIATFALQRGGFVLREWLTAKGLWNSFLKRSIEIWPEILGVLLPFSKYIERGLLLSNNKE